MDDNIMTTQVVLTGLIAAGTAIWGWLGWMFILWAVCMALDYLTGSLSAKRNHEWNSDRARDGLWHKGGMIAVVLVAVVLDMMLHAVTHTAGISMPFDLRVLLTPICLAWYILTELGSIVENAVKMGAPVPAWLRKGLKIATEAVDKAGKSATEGGAKNERDE